MQFIESHHLFRSHGYMNNLEIAKQAAFETGEFLKKNFYKSHKLTLDHGRDIKLKIDEEAEELILKIIKQHSTLPILSEESGVSSVLGEKYWVVDPLDGSSNYFRKIDICAISIALIENDKPVLGVINDFMNDDLYYASKNEGAFCNQEAIEVSNVKDVGRGTIMTGIPAKEDYSDDEFALMIKHFHKWKKVRMIGSAAVANLYVASGRADCYEEKDTFIWDIAAGSIIVEEAGGMAIISDIRNDYRVDAKFTNGKLN